MSQHAFDLVVAGGGPGGYVAAIRGAQLGISVALVEECHLGGICLNSGCIPTKWLLWTADVYRTVTEGFNLEVRTDSVTVDLTAAVQGSRDVSAQLTAGIAHLPKKNNVTVFDGRGYARPAPQPPNKNRRRRYPSAKRNSYGRTSGRHQIAIAGSAISRGFDEPVTLSLRRITYLSDLADNDVAKFGAAPKPFVAGDASIRTSRGRRQQKPSVIPRKNSCTPDRAHRVHSSGRSRHSSVLACQPICTIAEPISIYPRKAA